MFMFNNTIYYKVCLLGNNGIKCIIIIKCIIVIQLIKRIIKDEHTKTVASIQRNQTLDL